MKLFIRNMVCDRCKMVVKSELTQFGLHPRSVALGVVELEEVSLSTKQLNDLDEHLQTMGFELISDKQSQIVEQIKTTVIELIHRDDDGTRMTHSNYIMQQLGKEYPYLSKLFSDLEATTIEQYIILQKIEKVKELLAYGELTLSAIADQLGYSSVAALSTQFKKVVGITPSAYKTEESGGRKTLDKVGK